MTHTTSRFELSIPLVYIETTIPSGVTIDEYRRSRPQGRSRRLGAAQLLLAVVQVVIYA